jgi:hypothetical protein
VASEEVLSVNSESVVVDLVVMVVSWSSSTTNCMYSMIRDLHFLENQFIATCSLYVWKMSVGSKENEIF